MNRQLLQQEPVAEVYRFRLGGHARSIGVDDVRKLKGVALPPPGTKLYAAPVATEPDGWVMVPREPTPEMIAAGESAFRSYCFRHINGAVPTYEAMIAAAPAHRPLGPAGPADMAHYDAIAASYRAAPAQPAVPLTDEQIRSMWKSSEFRGNGGQVDWFCEGIRAAEAHHGITGASK